MPNRNALSWSLLYIMHSQGAFVKQKYPTKATDMCCVGVSVSSSLRSQAATGQALYEREARSLFELLDIVPYLVHDLNKSFGERTLLEDVKVLL